MSSRQRQTASPPMTVPSKNAFIPDLLIATAKLCLEVIAMAMPLDSEPPSSCSSRRKIHTSHAEVSGTGRCLNDCLQDAGGEKVCVPESGANGAFASGSYLTRGQTRLECS